MAARQLVDGETRLTHANGNIAGIFMHIHKCGGTSIIRAVSEHPTIVAVAARPGNFAGRTGVERIADDAWRRAVKFTFVRNPYARIFSAYQMFSRHALWSRHFESFSQFVEVLQWLDVHCHTVDREVEASEFDRSIHNVIQHCSSFSNPKYLIGDMNFIGRLEDMDEDLKALKARLNADIAVPHLNQSRTSETYKDAYGDREKRIVRRLYAEDLETFSYSF